MPSFFAFSWTSLTSLIGDITKQKLNNNFEIGRQTKSAHMGLPSSQPPYCSVPHYNAE